MPSTPISKTYVFMRIAGHDTPVGILDLSAGTYRFAYAKSWLGNSDAFAIDPLNLPLGTNTFESRKLWLCFEDAGPDRWGKRVTLSLHSQAPGNAIEWLIASRGAGVGALRFSAALSKVLPDVPVPVYEDLKSLMEMADAIESGDVDVGGMDPRLAKALWHGSSMGGARPKVVVSKDGVQWIAKLGSRTDTFDQVKAESAFLQMAKDCGMFVETLQQDIVGGKPVLLVRRFDRVDQNPVHYLSANALINLHRLNPGDINSRASYGEIALIIRKISASPRADLAELYRRMAFNVLIGNTDDHLKNHGFLHEGKGQYRLSPAFDILPHPAQMSQNSLIVGDYGYESSLRNLLSNTLAYGLNSDEAKAIINNQINVLRLQDRYYDEVGLSQQDRVIMKRASSRLFVEKKSSLTDDFDL
jgi:serine/threonine-protein kinase HipA